MQTASTGNRAVRLADIVDRHRGERFLVCGNGTSIDQFPRSFYTDWPGVTIGVNNITDLFEPDYYFDIQKDARILWRRMEDGTREAVEFNYYKPSTQVPVEKCGQLSMVGTGAIPAFTAAYQLGASEIYLVGIDFKPGPHGRIYFKECRKPAPSYYQLADAKNPELEATLRTFRRAFDAYRAAGVPVYNLSRNSRLEGIEVRP